MVKCQHCGRKIPYDANLCPYCGRSIKQFQQKDILDSSDLETGQENENKPEQIYQPPKQKNDKKFLFFILAVLALLIIAGLIYRSSINDDEEDNSPVASDTIKKADVNTDKSSKQIIKFDSKKTQYVVVNGDGVRFRFGPSTKHPFLKDEKGNQISVNKGTRLKCVGEQDNWYKVIYKDKLYFMSKDYTYLVE